AAVLLLLLLLLLSLLLPLLLLLLLLLSLLLPLPSKLRCAALAFLLQEEGFQKSQTTLDFSGGGGGDGTL
ncbi:hypothetical protein LY78DRAFT_664481, partial [Colletotrichum sublineola]